MKRIYFITKEYLPQYNATVACVENIMPYLAEKFHVSIFTSRFTIDSRKFDEIGNLRIYRIQDTSLFVLIKRFTYSFVSKNIANAGIKFFFMFVSKVLFKLYSILSYGIRSKKNKSTWKRDFLDILDNDVVSCKEPEFIFAVGAPFENIEIALETKKRCSKSKLVLILLDQYTFNPTYGTSDALAYEFEKRRLTEDNWYNQSDFIFTTKEVINKISRDEVLGKHINKVFEIKVPLFRTLHKNQIYRFSKEISFVYTGIFYEEIRNPKFLLQLFEILVKKDERIVLHIYSQGCENILSSFRKVLGKNLVLHGYKEKGEVSIARQKSNFLINLSNKTDTQFPSKIIEYISELKPIINLYSIENDLCKEILNNNPYSISIFEDFSMLEEIARKLYSFILFNFDVKIDGLVLENVYREYKPEYVANQILKEINE